MHHWQHGRWQGARQCYSPNYEARPAGESIDLIVLHNISLPPFEYQHTAIEQLFTNSIQADEHPFFSLLTTLRVSSHFLITCAGETIQFVSCDDMAYHAGLSQFAGRDKCNRFSIGIELEGCDFEPFSEAQYASLLPLLTALQQAYPIRAITGHQHIAPQRKTDPGHFFDWTRLYEQGFPIVLQSCL